MLTLRDRLGPNRLHLQGRFLLIIPVAFSLLGCGGDDIDESDEPAADSASLLPAPETASDCGDSGSLQAEIFGEFAGQIDWSTDQLRCEGMPRPDGAGARIRFAGSSGADTGDLAFIIAIPELRRGETASELAANVTLIEEGRGRFFSTSDMDTCWTDVSAQDALESDAYSISGELYCISPLAEVNGDSSVSIESLRYSGLVDWSAN